MWFRVNKADPLPLPDYQRVWKITAPYPLSYKSVPSQKIYRLILFWELQFLKAGVGKRGWVRKGGRASNGERVTQLVSVFHQMQLSVQSHEMSSQRKYELLFLLTVDREVEGTRIYLQTCFPHGTPSPWHFQVATHQPIWQSLESQIPRCQWHHLHVCRVKSGVRCKLRHPYLLTSSYLGSAGPMASCAPTAIRKALGKRWEVLSTMLKERWCQVMPMSNVRTWEQLPQ